MFYDYKAFQLVIRSNRALPGLLPADDVPIPAVDITLVLSAHDFTPLPDGQRRLMYTSPYTGIDGRPILIVWSVEKGQYYRFRYDEGTEFVIDAAGRRIWGAWPADMAIEDIAPYISGPILGFALRRRLVVCLHASAVAIADDQAIAFAGPAGAGKSTLAAAFARLGYPVLADDVVALRESEGGFFVLPAHPHIRLWEPSVTALFGSATALPRIAPADPHWTKRFLQLDAPGYPFPKDALRLVGLYRLDARSPDLLSPQLATATATDNALFLVANTYMNYVLDAPVRAHEFDLLSRLVQVVPMHRLTVPLELGLIEPAARSILAYHRPAVGANRDRDGRAEELSG